MKKRWFINAREERDFNKKKNAGEIRPEVLDFKDDSGEGMSTTAAEIGEKG